MIHILSKLYTIIPSTGINSPLYTLQQRNDGYIILFLSYSRDAACTIPSFKNPFTRYRVFHDGSERVSGLYIYFSCHVFFFHYDPVFRLFRQVQKVFCNSHTRVIRTRIHSIRKAIPAVSRSVRTD